LGNGAQGDLCRYRDICFTVYCKPMPIKLIMYAVSGLLASGLLWKAYDLARDHFINAANVQQQLSNERIAHERTQGELSSLQETNDLNDAHDAELVRIRSEHSAQMQMVREETEEAKQVLEDRERLQKVSAGRPTLVAKLANKATEKVFDDLEAIFND